MKHLRFANRIAALVLVLAMLFSLAACNRGETEPSGSSSASSEPTSSSSSIPPFINPLDDPDLSAVATPEKPTGELLQKITDAYNQNNDVVGWLTVADTTIDDPIVQYTDNVYYERKNLAKQYDFYGCYWADYECVLGDRNALSQNTIIYGHSMNDNPEDVKFSQLKHYLDIDYLKSHPYIYFSTPEDEMAWKVFAVSTVDTQLAYNHPEMKTEDFMSLIQELKDRSHFDIDVDVKSTDKILLLSTCTYPTGYSNPTIDEQTKFLIVARLVRPGEQIDATLEAVPNEDQKQPQYR